MKNARHRLNGARPIGGKGDHRSRMDAGGDTITDAFVLKMSVDAVEAKLTQTIERFSGVLLAVLAAQQLLMVAGIAMFQAGVVQPKNVTSVLVKSLFDTVLTSLSWWLIGTSRSLARALSVSISWCRH